MSWKIIQHYRQMLACETGLPPKKSGAGITCCLVYPNRYHAAMSNLGFQAVYSLLNSYSGISCERAFLPDREDLDEYRKSGSRLMSLESQRPLPDFDIIAFSVSFESDYLNLPDLFHLAGIPPFASERDSSHPLIIAGGAALFLNPEPVADFMDLICIGEAEPLLPELVAALTGDSQGERRGFLQHCANLPGIYVPSLYTVTYGETGIAAVAPLAGAPARVRRLWDGDASRPTTSEILTEGTEFSDMFLIEVARGCPRGCRFCAAGFIYLPYRQRQLEAVKAEITKGLQQRKKIGLVGAAVSDYREIGALCRFIREGGGKVSVSSLRIDCLDDELIDTLQESGHKTVSLAPEGGSQRLRDLIRKNITEDQILAACDRLIGRGILNLKLYFIIGLPTETGADLEEMVRLVKTIRERVIAAARLNKRLGEVSLSVNPFIPKPFTPFQWCGMEGVKSLEKKTKFLQRALGPLSNVRMQVEGLKEAYVQGLLSRGDRRLGPMLVKAQAVGWKAAAKELGLNTDDYVTRRFHSDELLPWDFIDSGSKERLLEEYRQALGDHGRTAVCHGR